MTNARFDLMSGLVLAVIIGFAIGVGQYLIAGLAAPIAVFMLWPVWRMGGHRVELSVSLAQVAESDRAAHEARRAALTNGGVRGPHTRPEDPS
jgi:hypothetical protein